MGTILDAEIVHFRNPSESEIVAVTDTDATTDTSFVGALVVDLTVANFKTTAQPL